jgi:hypothetical protein
MATPRIYDYGNVMKLLEHSVIALALQAIIGLVTGDWWMGAAAGSLLFVGREHAQAEYRNIEHTTAVGGRTCRGGAAWTLECGISKACWISFFRPSHVSPWR